MIEGPNGRICRTCKEFRTPGELYKDKRYSYGFNSQCRACRAKRGYNYYQTSDKAAGRRASNKWTAANPRRVMLNCTRRRAKLKGIEFALTLEDIVVPEVCPILGIPLQRSLGTKGGAWDSPSIDRIDNNKGYIPGNVWIISLRANMMKSSASVEDLKAFSRWIERTYE